MVIPRVVREQIEEQMPDPRVSVRVSTFQSAYSEIEDAAFNRRMITREYIGRAALAFAVYDSHGEVLWDEIMEKEPPISDLVLGGYRKERLRGRGHGDWQIVRLR
jgi:hypothetical protein